MVIELGFLELYDVTGRLSIADLFLRSKPQCGIYLLGFSDGMCYIGKATDVVRRFAQHRKNYSNIVRFGFQVVKPNDLDRIEQNLIHQAELCGIPLINKVHVSNMIGETDLDLLFSPDEQNEWLFEPSKFWDDVNRVQDEKQRARDLYKFAEFQKHPRSQEVIALLSHYIKYCIPAFRMTEHSFWSVSCLPSTNKNTFPRLACININAMETFVVGYEKTEPDRIWSFVNIAKAPFEQVYRKPSYFYRKHPDTNIREVRYRTAGSDQMNVAAEEILPTLDMLQDDVVQSAARHLNLRLMRKGATWFSRYHCFSLADHCV